MVIVENSLLFSMNRLSKANVVKCKVSKGHKMFLPSHLQKMVASLCQPIISCCPPATTRTWKLWAGKMEVPLFLLLITKLCHNKGSSILPLSGDIKREVFDPC